MKYYIYPNGGNAKYIAWAIDFLNSVYPANNKDIYSFVDDVDENNSLKVLSKIIKKEIMEGKSKLLLASPVHSDQLLENIRNCKISECYDGVSLIAEKLNLYFKEKYKDHKRIIAIMLNGYELTQKHLGDIPERLENSGFKIIYIVTFSSRWSEGLENKLKNAKKDYLFAEFEFLEHLDFFPFLIEQADMVRVNYKVKSLKLFTSMENIESGIFCSENYIEARNYAFATSSYLNIHFNSIYSNIADRQRFFDIFPNSHLRLIKGGYPSIDKQKTILNYNTKRDTVIIVSSDPLYLEISRFSGIITELLENGLRVLFKKHPVHTEYDIAENRFAEKFLKYKDFVYYKEPRLSNDELGRSITLIGQVSSMVYSFPVQSGRPAILLYPSRNSIDESKLLKDTFFNSNLHMRFFKEEDDAILENIKKLAYNKEYQKKWQEKIEEFCNYDLYNYGCASEYIANWIIDWYNKRDLLVKD